MLHMGRILFLPSNIRLEWKRLAMAISLTYKTKLLFTYEKVLSYFSIVSLIEIEIKDFCLDRSVDKLTKLFEV